MTRDENLVEHLEHLLKLATERLDIHKKSIVDSLLSEKEYELNLDKYHTSLFEKSFYNWALSSVNKGSDKLLTLEQWIDKEYKSIRPLGQTAEMFVLWTDARHRVFGDLYSLIKHYQNDTI